MNQMTRVALIGTMLSAVMGCESPSPTAWDRPDEVYRGPNEMKYGVPSRPFRQPPVPPTEGPQGETPEVPLRRPLPPREPVAPEPAAPTSTAPDIIRHPTGDATQHPSSAGSINAVQFYRFLDGGVYEIMTAPGFVTVLRLAPGEELKHLAAGDTSRWLIDIVSAGNSDSDENGLWPRDIQPEMGRVCVLIKPRFPGLKTNLIIATNERTYMVDLKSSEETYQSSVEWTYPKPPTLSPPPVQTTTIAPTARSFSRNYIYSLLSPSGAVPDWAPEAVYDDGHSIHVQFHPSINDVRRPPLYLLEHDGTVRMVNFRTEPFGYVVDELFDRALLHIGDERVIIQRTLPRPSTP